MASCKALARDLKLNLTTDLSDFQVIEKLVVKCSGVDEGELLTVMSRRLEENVDAAHLDLLDSDADLGLDRGDLEEMKTETTGTSSSSSKPISKPASELPLAAAKELMPPGSTLVKD